MSAAPRAALLVAAAFLGGCGYQLAATTPDAAGPFVVVAAPASVPHGEAVVAATAGARSELARAGQLATACTTCTSLVVALVRVDEVPAATALAEAGSRRAAFADGSVPLARGLELRVVGRAHLEPSRAGDVRDTGEVVAVEVVARSDDPRLATATVEAAVRRAARRLGERLARRILGVADP